MSFERLILLSDIHANLTALRSVAADFRRRYDAQGIVLLGDIINYGMRPNETIVELESLGLPIVASLAGNHERGWRDGDSSHFSTDRGRRVLDYTSRQLSPASRRFLLDNLCWEGTAELTLGSRRVLLTHATASDPFWGKMTDEEMADPRYADYDFVLAGHSHVPMLREVFYPCNRPDYRDKRRTVFINPGSVGQPRDHNPLARYAYWEPRTETLHFNCVAYDIAAEQNIYTDEVDDFYRRRLTNGI